MKIIQIKNRPLRAFVSAIAMLAMIVTGLVALFSLCYLIGYYIGFFGDHRLCNDIFSTAGIGCAMLVEMIIILAFAFGAGYGIYIGIKKLYSGPFDP